MASNGFGSARLRSIKENDGVYAWKLIDRNAFYCVPRPLQLPLPAPVLPLPQSPDIIRRCFATLTQKCTRTCCWFNAVFRPAFLACLEHGWIIPTFSRDRPGKNALKSEIHELFIKPAGFEQPKRTRPYSPYGSLCV